MTLILPALAVVFAAFCVWLVVRIVNRRERWAKWTLAAVVGAPVLHVMSLRPPSFVAPIVTPDTSISITTLKPRLALPRHVAASLRSSGLS
jgi:hypothetical protein